MSARSPQSPRAHPRVRGEHYDKRMGFNTDTGSSPRARGAHGIRRRYDVDRGLIPACAGSTRPPPYGRGDAGAHPRVRGEHP